MTLLLNYDQIIFVPPPMSLNLATLLPDPDLEPPIHDCQQVLAEVHGWCKDLSGQPLADAEATWFTDGSSLLEGGKQKAGASLDNKSCGPRPYQKVPQLRKLNSLSLTRLLS